MTQTIEIWQAILVALFYYLSQSCWLAGMGYWTLYRPFIGGALVGIVLGHPAAGLAAGGAINLAYIGQTGVGGTLPADMALAGYVGTVLVVAQGLDVQTALALALPVGLLGTLIYQLRMTLSSAFVRMVDQRAMAGDVRGLLIAGVLPSQLLLALLTIPACFAAVYWGPQALEAFLAIVPDWLMTALTLLGGLLPAVGLGQVMAYLWKGDTLAVFALGFVAMGLLNMPILGVSIMIAALAWLVTRRDADVRPEENAVPQARTGLHRVLRPVDLVRSWLRWLFFSHACFNWERMQGTGFAMAMSPLARHIDDDQERAELLSRHTVFFNAEPNLGGFVVGTALGIEESRLSGGGPDIGETSAVKAALMGPVSGVGDSLLQAALGTALISAAVGGALEGSWLSVVVYAVTMAVIIWGGGWLFFRYGYVAGAGGFARLLNRASYQRVLAVTEMIGAGVLGGIAAIYVRPGQFGAGSGFNWIGPLLVLGIAWLLRRRVSIRLVLLGVVVLALVLAILGVSAGF